MSQAFENKIDQERQPEVIVCKKMAENPGIGFLLVIPGFLLVVGGVLILIEPRILVWLMAGASISIGLVMVFFRYSYER